MGWAAKKRPAGPPAEPGSIRKDRNVEEVSAARALRPGAAGLKGSDAHPISGSATTVNAIGPAQPWPDLRSSKDMNPRSGLADRREIAPPRHADRHPEGRDPSGARSERSGDRAAVPQGGANPCLAFSGVID